MPSDSDSSLHSKCFLSHKSSGLHTAREHLETAFPATSCLHGVPRATKERPQVAPCAHRDTTPQCQSWFVPSFHPSPTCFPSSGVCLVPLKMPQGKKSSAVLVQHKTSHLGNSQQSFPSFSYFVFSWFCRDWCDLGDSSECQVCRQHQSRQRQG